MTPYILCLTASLHAFAPAPVLRLPGGPLDSMSSLDSTITLKCDGKYKVFKVAPDAKVTMNGQKGYSLDDLADSTDSQNPQIRLIIKGGIAESLDVTITLRRGQKLWAPGMGPGQRTKRRIEDALREVEDRERQGKQ